MKDIETTSRGPLGSHAQTRAADPRRVTHFNTPIGKSRGAHPKAVPSKPGPGLVKVTRYVPKDDAARVVQEAELAAGTLKIVRERSTLGFVDVVVPAGQAERRQRAANKREVERTALEALERAFDGDLS